MGTERSGRDIDARYRNRQRSREDARLQLQPVGTHSRIYLALLCFVLPVTLSVVVPLFSQQPTAASRWIHETLRTQRALEQWLGPMLVAALAGAIWLVIDRLLQRHELSIDDDGLDIRTTLYHRHMAWADLDLAAARVIDIDQHPETKPLWKTNGVAVPGFRSGWFRSRRFRKLFVATAGGWRLLWLPTRLGYTLLLQPEHPGTLLERLRSMSNQSASAATRDAGLR